MIIGAIAALSLVSVSANASSSATRSVHKSERSLATGSVVVERGLDRDDLAVATQAAAAQATAARPADVEERQEAAAKAVTVPSPGLHRQLAQVSPACKQAINALKALRQAEVRSEPQWRAALAAARDACLPHRTAACQAAIDTLKALVQANHSEWWKQFQAGLKNGTPSTVGLADLRTAVNAVGTACAVHE
jgi:hypothetical protein